MNPFFLLPFLAGFFSLLLAAVAAVRKSASPASTWFCAGMVVLGLDSLFTGLSLRAAQLGDVFGWLTPAFVAKSFVPIAWLPFTLTYSRSNYREFLKRWTLPLALFGLIPIVVSISAIRDAASGDSDLWWLQAGPAATVVNISFLVALVLILMNLEQTLRAAVGTMRWRIKLAVVALALIFGARLYVRSQAILFSAPDIAQWNIESGGLLLGCVFLAVAYARTRWDEIDVYPSLAVLRSSFTVVIVGGYLLVVGILAQLVRRFGGAEIFQFQAIVVLAGMAGLAVLLLSDRGRQKLQSFVSRHFSKAQHDSARIWTLFSQHLSSVRDQSALCDISARLISETFDALSVTIWLFDAEKSQFTMTASTNSRQIGAAGGEVKPISSSTVLEGLRGHHSAFDLENPEGQWAEQLRTWNGSAFSNGGNRFCVPLGTVDQVIGCVILADRVGAVTYSIEELELMKCIGDQITSVLLNLRLGNEVARARELEAFRTMSAFFVHDLKNTASSLNLILKNLPVHFDDPAFREDALRGIGNTARRIDEMIARLSALRQRPESLRVVADLNQLVCDALDSVKETANVQITRELMQVPRIVADPEQIQSVVTNLVLNARDAVGPNGTIRVRTESRGERVMLLVIDNGCGMTQAFINDSLFRPFQSTKKKGLGIGLFQSRAIVLAHGGGMHVESQPGAGTTLVVTLPAKVQ